MIQLIPPVIVCTGLCDSPAAQVSWCKLEVELTSPKAISTGVADLAKRDAPPLVVAALNLKTVLQAKVGLQQPSRQQHCTGFHETADFGD